MAWTLYLLIGITVVTASAFKCKHTSDSSDHDLRYHPDYGYQVPIEPGARPYERMNTRSAETLPTYIQNVPVEVRRSQLRIQEPSRRAENGSKILSWKPYVESRRGQASNDKIVFPGPTSDDPPIEISEECMKIGICEHVPNYPQEAVNKVIEKLGADINMLQNDELDLPAVPDIAQRLGPVEEYKELCNLQTKVMYPQAALDSNGNWQIVLNIADNPLQGFKVEICETHGSPCSNIILKLQDGYTSRCIQKFVYRKMAVLHNGTKLEKSLKVPSCCSCVANMTHYD